MSELLADLDCVSIHLYFDSEDIYGPIADDVIAHCVSQGMRALMGHALASDFFFVRYKDPRSHIRVRLLLTAENAQTANEVLNELEQSNAQSCRRTLMGEALTQLWLPPVTRATRVPYEPELARYGGPKAMATAHEIFCATSEAALRAIPLFGRDRSRRLGQGLLSLLTLCHSFVDDPVEWLSLVSHVCDSHVLLLRRFSPLPPVEEQFDELFVQQRNQLLETIGDIVARLERGESLTPAMDILYSRTKAASRVLRQLHATAQLRIPREIGVEWMARLRWLVSSYLHMMHNRYGLTRFEEGLVAHFARKALPEISRVA